ncbi:MAG: YggS family pyridoxal phosphate-dependent enzyme [Gemmatimonadetes bacterium]|nr:YggS family pyridoxal phosphate-dependent enzyme [Gemmatimonadota bacterium]
MEFLTLPDRVAEVRQKISAAVARGGRGQEVRIIAVTKTHGPEAVVAAIAAGLADVGENKVQEAVGKQDALMTSGGLDATPSVRWHLIGHLQRNKVKALDRFALFHAVDSVRLADAIAEWSAGRGRTTDVLLEVNVSGEESKGGYAPAEFAREVERLKGLAGIRVAGVMTMAPFDADEATLRRVFSGAREARELCLSGGHPAQALSMGMSGDYEIAVEEGATMVRLGTVLFGERTP